ncbi:MAG: ABC transporter permease [Acidobacteria bacterium]|nr:MAG: ABC transporter permease [Acidobacteriota bacterium]
MRRRRRMLEELDADIREHIERETQDNVERGMTPEEARYAAMRKFGNVTLVKEDVREVWSSVWLGQLLQDVRYALRMLRKSPGFSAVAVLTLALGIGANTAIFSLVNGMLLRKPPVRDPNRLMVVSSKWAGNGGEWDRLPVSAPNFLDWRAQATAFNGMVAANFDDYTISGGTMPERVSGGRVSCDFFHTLGVAATLGRTILPGEDQPGHDHVVVLSDGLWKEKFGGDPGILGRVIRVNGNSHTIVGVMPRSFRLWDFDARMWVPLAFSPEELAPAARNTRFLRVFARLKAGITAKQAVAEMDTIAQRIAEAHPDTNKGWATAVKSLQEYSIEDGNVSTALLFLTVAVSFVLLIACANMANLLLARSLARQHEFAIRAALGAGRARLARQLLSECLILSLGGAGPGLLLAYWGMRALRAQMNWNEGAVSLAKTIQLDVRVLVFALVISAASAFVFGLLPALQVSRTDLKEGLRSSTGGRERHRLQRLLVIGQIALSLILLTSASLFIEGFLEEVRASAGFNIHNVLTASVSLRGLEYYGAPHREAAFFENALRNLGNLPETESAAVTSDLPFSFPNEKDFEVEGQPVPKPDEQPRCGYFIVSADYFATLQIPLLQGRGFNSSDNSNSSSTIIVDRAFARRYFANGNPIGRHLKVIEGSGARDKWMEIVGVVGDVNEFLGQRDSRPHFFEPFQAYPSGSMNFVVRTRSDAAGFSDGLRRAIWAVDGNQAVARVRTMEGVIADAGQGDDLMAEMMAAFAGIALALASIGIYGVISYIAGQRMHEMGIRMTLGARPNQVMRSVIRSGMSVAGIGVALGLMTSLALPRLIAASFNGFHASAVSALVAAPVVVAIAAFLACYVPARRAMRVEPMVALRHE